jgi:hypothetical protein
VKGYKKEEDVRYALSENELLLEVRRVNQVARVCKTFNKEVDVDGSSVDLLVDYIAVKLKKQDMEVSWDQVGYDIASFTLPRRGQMKSNFLKYTPPPIATKPEQVEQEENSMTEGKENTNSNNVVATTQETKEDQIK